MKQKWKLSMIKFSVENDSINFKLGLLSEIFHETWKRILERKGM